MPEKILEQQIKKSLTKKTRDNINKRLDELKDHVSESWSVDYIWDASGNNFYIKSGKVLWTATFSKKKVTVYMEAPFYLRPFLSSYRKKGVEILQEELKELI
jgi:hypothetical protein